MAFRFDLRVSRCRALEFRRPTPSAARLAAPRLTLAPSAALAQVSGAAPIGVGQVILFVLVVCALVAGADYLLVSRAQGGVAIRYSDED